MYLTAMQGASGSADFFPLEISQERRPLIIIRKNGRFLRKQCPNCQVEGWFRCRNFGKLAHAECGWVWYLSPREFAVINLPIISRTFSRHGRVLFWAFSRFLKDALFRSLLILLQFPIQIFFNLTRRQTPTRLNPLPDAIEAPPLQEALPVFEPQLLSPSAEEPEATVPADMFTRILSTCILTDAGWEQEMEERRLLSLKLDLRAIQEVGRMDGLITEEEFDELLLFPKVQDFIAKTQHEESEIQAFWLIGRIKYLASLTPSQRALVIQASDRSWHHPALAMSELFKLPELKHRLCLLSRLSFREFESLIREIDKREMTLTLAWGIAMGLMALDEGNLEIRRSTRRTWIARG